MRSAYLGDGFIKPGYIPHTPHPTPHPTRTHPPTQSLEMDKYCYPLLYRACDYLVLIHI